MSISKFGMTLRNVLQLFSFINKLNSSRGPIFDDPPYFRGLEIIKLFILNADVQSHEKPFIIHMNIFVQ